MDKLLILALLPFVAARGRGGGGGGGGGSGEGEGEANTGVCQGQGCVFFGPIGLPTSWVVGISVAIGLLVLACCCGLAWKCGAFDGLRGRISRKMNDQKIKNREKMGAIDKARRDAKFGPVTTPQYNPPYAPGHGYSQSQTAFIAPVYNSDTYSTTGRSDMYDPYAGHQRTDSMEKGVGHYQAPAYPYPSQPYGQGGLGYTTDNYNDRSYTPSIAGSTTAPKRTHRAQQSSTGSQAHLLNHGS